MKGNTWMLINTTMIVPKLVLEDTRILSLFFDNLELEQTNVRVYVQDALSSMIDIYTLLPESSPIYGEVKEIILNAVQKVCSSMALIFKLAMMVTHARSLE